MMKYLRSLLVALVLMSAPAYGAESSGSYSVVLPGDIGFGAGGVGGEFLIFKAWSATPSIPYGANTVVKHSSALWVALTAPAAANEPGVDAVWEKITDQPTGSGASITAGTADPTAGNDGDAYFQVDSSSVVQSLWRNASGTWTEYTLPTGSGGGVTLSDASPENVAAAGKFRHVCGCVT